MREKERVGKGSLRKRKGGGIGGKGGGGGVSGEGGLERGWWREKSLPFLTNAGSRMMDRADFLSVRLSSLPVALTSLSDAARGRHGGQGRVGRGERGIGLGKEVLHVDL